MTKSVFSEQLAKQLRLKLCPFCGCKPAVSDFAIPTAIWCENEKCPLGPNRLVTDGFGKATYDKKIFTVELWNDRPPAVIGYICDTSVVN